MNPEVILISRPTLETPTFLSILKHGLGIGNVTAPGKPSPEGLFLGAVSAFTDDSNPTSNKFSHLHYSFAFIASRETIFKSLELTQLTHTIRQAYTGQYIALVSGNLPTWKSAVIDCCNQKTDYQLRLTYDKVLVILESFGLKELWSDYKKQTHKDSTFYLEKK